LPTPGAVLALAERPPIRSSFVVRIRGCDSPDVPLMRFSPPARYVPIHLPPVSRPEAPLVGFSFPSAHEAGRVHVRRLSASLASAVPTPPTTVSLAGFFDLSATCSSPRRPAIFGRVTLLGFFPKRVTPLTKPRQLVTAGVPSELAPVGCAFPPVLASSGVAPRENRSASSRRIYRRADRSAPPGLASSWCAARKWEDCSSTVMLPGGHLARRCIPRLAILACPFLA